MEGVGLVLKDRQWRRIGPHQRGKASDRGVAGDNRRFVEGVVDCPDLLAMARTAAGPGQLAELDTMSGPDRVNTVPGPISGGKTRVITDRGHRVGDESIRLAPCLRWTGAFSNGSNQGLLAMIDVNVILATLDQVAERHGDPKDRVYDRLFELHPECERLFAPDRDGGVRGSMLQTSVECMIGIAEQQDLARYLIEAAGLHHGEFGVREDQLDAMFEAMRDVFREILGVDWTSAMEAEWSALLIVLSRIP